MGCTNAETGEAWAEGILPRLLTTLSQAQRSQLAEWRLARATWESAGESGVDQPGGRPRGGAPQHPETAATARIGGPATGVDGHKAPDDTKPGIRGCVQELLSKLLGGADSVAEADLTEACKEAHPGRFTQRDILRALEDLVDSDHIFIIDREIMRY